MIELGYDHVFSRAMKRKRSTLYKAASLLVQLIIIAVYLKSLITFSTL